MNWELRIDFGRASQDNVLQEQKVDRKKLLDSIALFRAGTG